MGASFFILLAVASLVLAGMQWWRREITWLHKLSVTMLILSVAGGALVLWLLVLRGTNMDWNEAKLAPVVAMSRGYALYQDPSSGVMTGWLYGPIGAIILRPVAIARDPSTAVYIGILICMFCYLTPVVWLLTTAAGKANGALAGAAIMLVVWQSCTSEDLFRCMSIAAADAPAVGFAVCACAAIYRSRSTANLVIAATSIVLAIWTKHNFLPIAVVIPLWVLIADGSRRALHFVGILLAIAAVITALLISMFGASNMFYHMLAMPSRHPFRNASDGLLNCFLHGLLDLASNCILNVGLLTSAIILDRLATIRAEHWRQWVRQRAWILLIVTAFALLPGSFLAYIKVGGYLNSLAPPNLFLLLAALTCAVQSCSLGSLSNVARERVIVLILLCGFVLEARSLVAVANNAEANLAMLNHPYRNSQISLFRYSQSHPREIYCPWNPLTTLLTDGRLYHFEWGMMDRALAQEPPSERQYRDHLPQNVEKVIYLRPPQGMAALDVLPQFRTQTQIPELPGCIVYTR